MTVSFLVETAFQASHFPVVDSDCIVTFLRSDLPPLPQVGAVERKFGTHYGKAVLFKRTIAIVLTRTDGTIATTGSHV